MAEFIVKSWSVCTRILIIGVKKFDGIVLYFRNSKRGGMATHAGVALELGIFR